VQSIYPLSSFRRRLWKEAANAVTTAAIVCLSGAVNLLGVRAQEGPPGITKPIAFPPFNSAAPACNPPSGLEKVLAFSQDNERKFMQGVSRGLALAAKNRGLEYRIAQANNDAAKMMEQVQGFLDSKVGALVVAPVDAPSLSRSLKQVIWSAPMSEQSFRLQRSRY
jgi:ribose transport system substrate-binding protein